MWQASSPALCRLPTCAGSPTLGFAPGFGSSQIWGRAPGRLLPSAPSSSPLSLERILAEKDASPEFGSPAWRTRSPANLRRCSLPATFFCSLEAWHPGWLIDWLAAYPRDCTPRSYKRTASARGSRASPCILQRHSRLAQGGPAVNWNTPLLRMRTHNFEEVMRRFAAVRPRAAAGWLAF